MSDDVYLQLATKYKFLTIAEYGEQEFIGIVQNCNNQIVSMYDLQSIPTKELRQKFLELGHRWWFESNRMIPINIFLKQDFAPFRMFLRTFTRKEFNVLYGPMTSLQEMLQRRAKRKMVQLVRDLDQPAA